MSSTSFEKLAAGRPAPARPRAAAPPPQPPPPPATGATGYAVDSPFGRAQLAPRAQSAPAASDGQRAIAEVQAAMVIARANPRDERSAMDRILNACTRPTLAEAAVYSYARGGTDISGPSIRLAETMAQAWGNLSFGVRELDQSEGKSSVQAFCWDMETNTRREVVFDVPHTRFARGGSTPLVDPRDIYETVANNGARRLRACILAILPGDVTEAAVHQCEATMKAKADTSPAAMAKLLEAFGHYGVNRAQIEKRIQRRFDSIQPAQVVALRKIFASLRDAMSVPSDWFDASAVPEPEKPTPKPEPPKADAPVGPVGPVGPTTDRPEGAEGPVGPAMPTPPPATAKPAASDAPSAEYADVLAAMLSAKKRDALDDAATLIGAVALPEQRRELQHRYDALRAELPDF